MALDLHPNWLSLRVLARKLEQNTLTQEDVMSITSLLRGIALGQDIKEVLGVINPANRPNKSTTEYYVYQVFGLTQPTYNGRSGLKVTDAIKKVADSVNVFEGTVKAAYYSKDGREYLQKMIDELKDPLA
jgi:hypothetical protein